MTKSTAEYVWRWSQRLCTNANSNICIYIIYSNICYNHQMFLIYLHTGAGCVTLWSPGFGRKTEIIVFQSGGFQSAQLFAFFIIQKVGWNWLREGLKRYCKGLVNDHINIFIYIMCIFVCIFFVGLDPGVHQLFIFNI